MTQDEIIRMAQEAGFDKVSPLSFVSSIFDVERFAALVAAHDRERKAEQEPSAKHWHDLYRAKCQELHDERARLGAEIVALEQEVLAEREACAKVCGQLITPWDENTPNGELIAIRNDGMRQCAAAIRARGNNAGN